MPLYEYSCQKCGKEVELLVLSSEKPRLVCKCGGKLKKLVSRAGFQLKGTGWYETDFKNSGKKKESPAKEAPSSSKKED